MRTPEGEGIDDSKLTQHLHPTVSIFFSLTVVVWVTSLNFCLVTLRAFLKNRLLSDWLQLPHLQVWVSFPVIILIVSCPNMGVPEGRLSKVRILLPAEAPQLLSYMFSL